MSASSWCNLPVYTSLVLEIGVLCYHLLFLYGAVYLTWDFVDAGQVLYHIPSLLFSLVSLVRISYHRQQQKNGDKKWGHCCAKPNCHKSLEWFVSGRWNSWELRVRKVL